jgi:hypothetical protein
MSSSSSSIHQFLEQQLTTAGVENVLLQCLGRYHTVSARYLAERCPRIFPTLPRAEQFLERSKVMQHVHILPELQREVDERVSESSISSPIAIPTKHYRLRTSSSHF